MNRPWIEKYRPTKLNNIIGQNTIIKLLKKSIQTNTPIPNLLFYGPPGTGKTTTILSYCYEMFGNDYMNYIIELNASCDNGINIIKSTISSFAKKRVIDGKFKMIILDEADAMTKDAQTALRKIMEDYSNTRFCIICNYHEKIIPAIVSRCIEFKFDYINKDVIKTHLSKIYEREFKSKIDDNLLNNICMLSNGDLRKSINMLQSLKYSMNTKETFYEMCGLIDDNKLNEIINKIKSIKTAKELLNVHKEIIRMNYSIKNIIKQILVFNNNDSLNELLNSNITDEFLLFGLIKILNE